MNTTIPKEAWFGPTLPSGFEFGSLDRLARSSRCWGILEHSYPAPHSSKPTTNVVIVKESNPSGPVFPNLVNTGDATWETVCFGRRVEQEQCRWCHFPFFRPQDPMSQSQEPHGQMLPSSLDQTLCAQKDNRLIWRIRGTRSDIAKL